MARCDPPKRRRTPPERSGTLICPRDERGWLLPVDALARFVEKCRFDPLTGCVLWIGGTTQGRGNTAIYGSFWYERQRWFAHRWAAKFIHKLDIDSVTVGHRCPHTADGHPNTLCVEHLAAQSLVDNVVEGNTRRPLRALQDAAQRQYWLFVDRGFEPAPAVHDPATLDADAIPYFTPPAWLLNATAAPTLEHVECPF